jgi:hypothetical protein
MIPEVMKDEMEFLFMLIRKGLSVMHIYGLDLQCCATTALWLEFQAVFPLLVYLTDTPIIVRYTRSQVSNRSHDWCLGQIRQ